MADERLLQFPPKTNISPADIVYFGDSSAAYAEVQGTVANLIGAYPGLLSMGTLTIQANTLFYGTGTNTFGLTSFTPFAQSLLDDTSAGQVMTTLGISTFCQGFLTSANAAAAAATLLVLPLLGGNMAGAINMGGFGIANMANPVNPADAATKEYVDGAVIGDNPPCVVSTTANLSGYTYSNGSMGVGATLTAGSDGAFAADGVTPPVNSRILVSFQTSAFQNGIYILTTAGNVSTPAVLTRATDFDVAGDMYPGYRVLVLQGTLYAGIEWVQTATVVTIGTDAIIFESIPNVGYLLSANNLSDLASLATSLLNLGFVQPSGAPNYITFPAGNGNNVILQWGMTSAISGTSYETINFPIAFPNACQGVLALPRISGGTEAGQSGGGDVVSTTQATISNTSITSCPFYWFAIGY